MRLEGHTALVQTAAASNLGRMLVRICQEDGIPLVNVVRRQEQAELLTEMGADHVCNSSAPDFPEQLRAAIAATGASIAFDAIGGGAMPGLLLEAMEDVAAAQMGLLQPLRLAQPQVGLHLRPSRPLSDGARQCALWIAVGRAPLGAAADDGAGGAQRAAEMQQRVLAGLRSTFASHYTREISLAQALDPETMRAYTRMATGEKFLINPSL